MDIEETPLAETSLAALLKGRGFTAQMHRVLALFEDAGDAGLTDDELLNAYIATYGYDKGVGGINAVSATVSGVRARRRDLRLHKAVRDSNRTRPSDAGNDMIVWVVVSAEALQLTRSRAKSWGKCKR